MIEAVSCGGVVICRWKILLLYKNQNGRYMGWVLPKGTVEEGETFKETALREVCEESGAHGHVIKYIGKTQYVFRGNDDMVNKSYKFHEAYHLLKFNDERQMLKRAFLEYADMKKAEGITPRNVILKGYNN